MFIQLLLDFLLEIILVKHGQGRESFINVVGQINQDRKSDSYTWLYEKIEFSTGNQ